MWRLTDLGWTDALAAALTAEKGPALVPGRVSLEHNHVYRVLTEGGERLAEAAGRIKYLASGRSELPAVGDWVARPPRSDRAAARSIRAILPRRSWFSRKAAGRETEEQVIAANVDTVFLVFGLDKPVNARSIERYLVVARRSGAVPVIVLNKADLADDVRRGRRRGDGGRRRRAGPRGRAPGRAGVHARARAVPPRRAHAGAARSVGRRQVVDRQPARRPRAPGDRRRPRVGRTRPSHERAPPAGRPRRRAASSSTRRGCASCSSGTPTSAVGDTFADIADAGRRAAGFAIAGTIASPAAR